MGYGDNFPGVIDKVISQVGKSCLYRRDSYETQAKVMMSTIDKSEDHRYSHEMTRLAHILIDDDNVGQPQRRDEIEVDSLTWQVIHVMGNSSGAWKVKIQTGTAPKYRR